MRNTPGSDWMVDEEYTQNMWIGHFGFRTMFPLYEKRSIEGGALCKLRRRGLVAARGSLRFGCQHPALRGIRSRGHLSV